MKTISIDDYVQAHDILHTLHSCLIDWHFWCEDKCPKASGPLLKAACYVYDATEALSLVAVDVCSVVVPPDTEEDEG